MHGAASSVSDSHSPSSSPSTPEKKEATRCLLPGPWQVMKIIKEGMQEHERSNSARAHAIGMDRFLWPALSRPGSSMGLIAQHDAPIQW